MSKKIVITLSNETYDLLKKVSGFGSKDVEIARGIILSWLAEKSIISTHAKNSM